MLNKEDLFFKHKQGNHNVRYTLYRDTRKKKKNTIYFPDDVEKEFGGVNNHNTACFAGLSYERTKHKNLTHICLYIKRFNDKHEVLSINEEKAWLSLSKKHGFLPKYVSVEKIQKTDKLILDMSRHTPNEIYIYLSTVRTMVAEPAHALDVVNLVKKGGIDYFTATVIAFQMTMSNSNHHFLPASCKPYPSPHTIEGTEAKTHFILALKKFIETMGEFQLNNANNYGFNCNHTIYKFATKFKKQTVKLTDLLGTNYA